MYFPPTKRSYNLHKLFSSESVCQAFSQEGNSWDFVGGLLFTLISIHLSNTNKFQISFL